MRDNYWQPIKHIKIQDWKEDYDRQLQWDRETVKQFCERQQHEAEAMRAVRAINFALAFTFIGLALAGGCFLARWLGWVR